ncbi:MAG: hypothetical protein KC731_32350 [Myxococcales bacterium]|nr:hypothetical protein [Myxococcales bacterium]
MWRSPKLLALLLLSQVGLGCGSHGLTGGIYRGDGFAFRMEAPGDGWRPLDAAPAALSYRNDAYQATIMVHGRCGLDGDDIPLTALTNHLFLDFTDREVKSQDVVPFDGREAMHTVLDAKLDGVPMTYDVWVLKKDGCVYDLLYLAPPGQFEAGRPDFEALVRGFATVPLEGHSDA